MKISQLHIGDIIAFSYLEGKIVEIDRKNHHIKVVVASLGEQPLGIDISLVEKIISPKIVFYVNLYWYEKDQVETYIFHTLKEAREFISKNTNKGEDDYTLTKRDRDTKEILEEYL